MSSSALDNVTAIESGIHNPDGSKGEELPRLPIRPIEKPILVIERSQLWIGFKLGELWSHRELLYFLVWRDLKVRYKQTLFGIGWVVLQPLLMTVIFTIVLGRLMNVPSGNVPYPLFAYSGLTLWTFFSATVSLTSNCLVSNANLITKVYFPRLIIPIASIIARLVDLGIACAILILLMFYYGISPSWQLLMAPLFVVLLSGLALGFGLWTSAVNVKYRDVGLALPVLIQIWMFVSPVIYGLGTVPEKWRPLFSLNPLVGILEGFRTALFGGNFQWRPIIISAAITLVLLIYGTYDFRKRERMFADVI